MKTGIFGGAFNPPHIGHLQIAEAALCSLKLDQLLFIPSGKSPHKTADPFLNARQRFFLTRLAVCEIRPDSVMNAARGAGFLPPDEFPEIYAKDFTDRNLAFEVSDIEICGNRNITGYTVDTLESLVRAHDDWDMTLVIGADQADRFDTWKEWESILRMACVAVAMREGFDKDGIGERFPQFEFFDAPLVNVSSSEIRRRLKAGEPVTGMTPPAVECLLETLF